MPTLLFLQEFSLQAKGGGAAILRRIKHYAGDYGYDVKVACDLKSAMNGGAKADEEIPVTTLPRNLRFGLGRVMGLLTLLGFDLRTKSSVGQIINQHNPAFVHVTAHGVLFPVFFWTAYRKCKGRVVISAHDLWELSVNNYIPAWIAHQLFRRCYRKAHTCFVISEEMGNYLNERYGERKYVVNHDGIESVFPAVEKKDFFSFLYVGLIHTMQVKMLNEFFRTLSKYSNIQFRLGICTVSTFQLDAEFPNIEVKNYGWVNETQLREISKDYAFGLLPLSFEEKDELFYRTSLMTKIPFYISVLLPIVCIGPSSSSAVKVIKQDKIGLCLTSNHDEDFRLFIDGLLSLNPGQYKVLQHNLESSAAERFNIKKIMNRFFSALNN